MLKRTVRIRVHTIDASNIVHKYIPADKQNKTEEGKKRNNTNNNNNIFSGQPKSFEFKNGKYALIAKLV